MLPAHLFACTHGDGFLPLNKLSIPVTQKTTGLTKEEYDRVISKISRIYRPIVHSYGGHLQVNRKWSSDVVNAGTYREDGTRNWIVNMYGGMARHPLMTSDGFGLVLCHEIGHHIGGAPKKIYERKSIWASTEGQSDYFATLKCLRKVFAQDDNEKIVQKMDVPSSVKTECAEAFKTKWERALCERTSMAGLAVAAVNAATREVPLPMFDSPDPAVVTETQNNHPEPQCRLDTYFQGSVCQVSSYQTVSQVYDRPATCHQKTHEAGHRPHCWYWTKK